MTFFFESILLYITLILWIIYALLNLFHLFKGIKAVFFAGIILHSICIAGRVFIIHHAPFSNIYETLIFFSFLYILKIIFNGTLEKKVNSLLIVPAILLLLTALLMPVSLKVPRPLMPALRSIWMYIHVPSIFLGYVSLTFAFVLSITYLFKESDLAKTIDKEIKSGFFFFTLGIITGSIWAEESWGIFWSWDPKETWALITWLLLLCTLHTKMIKVRIVFIILAFAAMLFTYLGVTYILPGLHSYL